MHNAMYLHTQSNTCNTPAWCEGAAGVLCAWYGSAGGRKAGLQAWPHLQGLPHGKCQPFGLFWEKPVQTELSVSDGLRT